MTENIRTGLELLLFGMGTVFSFLALLVGICLGMSRLVRRLLPPEQPTTDLLFLAAATAAVRRYRARHRLSGS